MKEQDIEICRKCRYFRENKEHEPFFGVGVYCACHGKWVSWSKEYRRAVSEEEFENAHIHFAPYWGECPQHPKKL